MERVQWHRDLSFIQRLLENPFSEEEVHLWACDCVEEEIQKIPRFSTRPMKGLAAKRSWTKARFHPEHETDQAYAFSILQSARWQVESYYYPARRRLLFSERGEPDEWGNVPNPKLLDSHRIRARGALATLQAMKVLADVAVTSVLFLTEDRERFLLDLEKRLFAVHPNEKSAVAAFRDESLEALFEMGF